MFSSARAAHRVSKNDITDVSDTLHHRVVVGGGGERALADSEYPGADVPVPSQVTMESPHREAEPGQQEQELRQILNKDKSKRSKSLACLLSVCVTTQRAASPNQGDSAHRGMEFRVSEGGSALSQPKLCLFLV